MSEMAGQAGRVEVAWGPERAETALLDAILGEIAALYGDPCKLASPLRVVVPSRSLRLHLGARMVARAGRPVLGLKIQTLSGLALEIVERAGEASPLADVLPLVVREQARAEARLRDSLDLLTDGYAAVEAAVVDLLDAGFDPVHAEAADERLVESASRGQAVDLARAVIRVAVRSSETLREHRVGVRSDLLARAAELLQEDREYLPSGGVFVHGFADATGRATELILALLRYRSAVVVLDLPQEPAALLSGSAEPPSEIFVDRFKERLAGVASVVAAEAQPASAPQLVSFSAVGSDGEAREVAQRIQQLLRKGVRPEGIGVVARDRDPYVSWLRLHFDRLGVPYSGLAPVQLGDSRSRRYVALVAMLRDRAHCATDRWLDARVDVQRPPSAGETGFGDMDRDDLRLGFRHHGAGRLFQAAALPRFANGMSLPVRRGFSDPASQGGDAPVAERRMISAVVVDAARDAAKQVHARLSEWPLRASLGEHAERLCAFALEDLAWDEEGILFQGLQSVVGWMGSSSWSEAEIAIEDFAIFMERRLSTVALRQLGGEGAGVQVLSVMEARARTFDHLFVLGLNRDVFPRAVREDALLPDEVREALSDLLPDMPIKRRGYEEERHLFAQLLASSPSVTLCWQHAGDDGRSRAPSTLLERLRWAHPDLVDETTALDDRADDLRLPVSEHAFEAALASGPDGLAPLLDEACKERTRQLASPRHGEENLDRVSAPPGELAAARIAILREWDRVPIAGAGLGPFFGFVGSPISDADPRSAAPWITQLEKLAACPWQSFLQGVLRVESLPDPLGELPEVSALELGSLVHRVLDRLASEVLREGGAPEGQPVALAELRARTPVAWEWPGDKTVIRCLREESSRLLTESGLGFAGLEEVLWRQAWVPLQVFRDLEWANPDASVSLLGAEVEAGVGVGQTTIRFRADRVDLRDGALLFTDYKTGKFFSKGVKEETRRKHFRERVEMGKLLQGTGYALAGGDAQDVGRYLYLDPETSSEYLEVRVPASDLELVEAFEGTASALLELRQVGGFAPRLVDSKGLKEPDACGWCEVAAVCLRGDSGARRRLRQWLEDGAVGTPGEQSLRKLWDVWKTSPSGRGAGS